MAEYDSVGVATDSEADELIAYVETLKGEVRAYLKDNHPELLDAR